MISAYRDESGRPAEVGESTFDPFTFRITWARRMHQISKKNNPLRRQVPSDSEQLLTCSRVGQRSQFATPPLGPTVSKMSVGHNGCPRLGNPEGG